MPALTLPKGALLQIYGVDATVKVEMDQLNGIQ